MVRFFLGAAMVMLGMLSIDFSAVSESFQQTINHIFLLMVIFYGTRLCLSSNWFLSHFET